jgi:DNA-binding HxlR family transcriptional regulator
MPSQNDITATRYGQIFKLVEGVSQRMLTLTSLERDGLVTRTV